MFKHLTILSLALGLFAVPFSLGCAGRPPAPELSEEAEEFGVGSSAERETDYPLGGVESDEIKPID